MAEGIGVFPTSAPLKRGAREKNGEITIQEGQNVYQEVYDMQAAELRTKGTITNSNNMLETSDLLQQRQQLISQREGLEGRLKELSLNLLFND